jgi:7 transmembrane sweet-taste receptor of 3 GCPR
MILTLAVAFVFWRHRHTPIIKAAGRELSAVLLAAIFLSFGKTFIVTAKPTTTVCGLTRFSLGLTHTISFAAIAVKTNRFVKNRFTLFKAVLGGKFDCFILIALLYDLWALCGSKSLEVKCPQSLEVTIDEWSRVARIFGQRSGASVAACPRAKYISPASQLAITAALTSIAVIINSFWLMYKKPRTTHMTIEW